MSQLTPAPATVLIGQIAGVDGTGLIAIAGHLDPIVVPTEYLSRCNPKVGGWFVLYPDGYTTYAPFETYAHNDPISGV